MQEGGQLMASLGMGDQDSGVRMGFTRPLGTSKEAHEVHEQGKSG